jgi:hypothetical protein
MAQATELVLYRQRPALDRAEAGEEERWPLAATALLVLGSSALLWSLIIAGVRWTIG